MQGLRENLGKGLQYYIDWIRFMKKGETALIVIDPQNDIVKEQGNLNYLGVWKFAKDNGTLEKIRFVVQICRKVAIPIFWVRMFYLTEGRDVFPETFDGERITTKREVTPDYQMEGTWQVDFVDEIKELINIKDIVVNKHTSSAIEGTPLERYLIQLGIRTLLLCGFITDYCVEGTSRTGRDRGYMTVLISDACAARCGEDQRSAVERHKWIMGPVIMAEELNNIIKSW